MRFHFAAALFLSVISALLLLFISFSGRENPLYFSIHFLIVFVSLLHIFRARAFDLGVSFSFFSLFFFGIIPLFEYKLGIAYNGATSPVDSAYVYSAIVALLSTLSFYVGNNFQGGSASQAKMLLPLVYCRRTRSLMRFSAAAAIVVVAAGIAAFYGFAPENILFRGYGEQIESTAFGYSLVNYFARPFLFNLVVYIVLGRVVKRGGPGIYGFLLIGIVILFVSPVGIPRSLAGALYIPMLTLLIFRKLNSKYGVICLVIFGVLFAAPVFDIFRVLRLGDEVNLAQNFNLDYLFAGHFDAFFNLTKAIELKYTSGGLQVVGALLFWVPRAIWSGKPMGTSFDFADFAGFRSANVSFPLTGDLYLDYGVGGVVVGMILVGFAYKSIDRFFGKPRSGSSEAAYIAVIAQQELAVLGIYLLRGSFLSSFSFTVGVAFSFLVLAGGVHLIRSLGRSRAISSLTTGNDISAVR